MPLTAVQKDDSMIPAEKNTNFIVSVIIPVYNVEAYLRQCLESTIRQTLRDIEIICVNDGSVDGCPAILEEYRERDPRVTVITQENRGLSAARNRGMEMARGAFICFLDSDDYLDPETLERTVPLVQAEDLDVLVFERELLFEADELRPLFPRPLRKSVMPTDVCSGVQYLKIAKDSGFYNPTAWGKIWRATFLRENALYFKEGIIHEDNLFSFQAFMAAEKVRHIPDVFYCHRIRPNSIVTRPKSHENVSDLFQCAEGMLAYAFCGPRSPEEDHEIRRAYASMIASSKRIYRMLPPEERAKVVFPSETTAELFGETVLCGIRIDDLQNRLRQLSPLKHFDRDDIHVVHLQNSLTLTNTFHEEPVQYAWYVYKGNEPILKQMYTLENNNSFSYEFTETGDYKIQAFIRTMDKAETRSIPAVAVTVDDGGLSWKKP